MKEEHIARMRSLKDNPDPEWRVIVKESTINNTIKVMKDIAPLIKWLNTANITPTRDWIDIFIAWDDYRILIGVDSETPTRIWFSILRWGKSFHWWYSKKYFKKCLHKYLIKN